MSYFPSDVPFMSEEELKENGIEIPKDSQTTQDLISRQAAIDVVEAVRDCISVEGYWAITERIGNLPAAQPDVPDTNVGDMISRQAAIDALKDEMRTIGGHYCEEDRIIYENDAIEAIQILPAAQSEPWKGR